MFPGLNRKAFGRGAWVLEDVDVKRIRECRLEGCRKGLPSFWHDKYRYCSLECMWIDSILDEFLYGVNGQRRIRFPGFIELPRASSIVLLS